MPTRISILSTHVSYKRIENVALNVTLLTIFMAHPVDYSINAHSMFCGHRVILQYRKQVEAAAQVCSEESASTTFSRTVA